MEPNIDLRAVRASSTVAPPQSVYRAVNLPLLDLIQSAPRRVLDLGCGDGGFGEALRQRFPGTEVIGVTSSAQERSEAGSRLTSVLLEDVCSPAIQSLGRFDAIICSHILEHLPEPQELLRRLTQQLDGVLYAAIPNALHWRPRLELFCGRVPYSEGGPFDRTHLRFFDAQSAGSLFTDCGYRVMNRVNAGNAPLGPARRLSRQLAQRLDRAATGAFPGLFAEQFLFAARGPTEA